MIIELPVVVDWVRVDAKTGEEAFRVEATVDLVGTGPAVVEMRFTARPGLQLDVLQREFRWASPLEVVTLLMPRLIAAGVDPFDIDLPVTGFPAAAAGVAWRRLSDDFLTVIAREYLARGRGYAESLAREFVVSPRTVVSWVEKARARGLLSPPPAPGKVGGHIIGTSS